MKLKTGRAFFRHEPYRSFDTPMGVEGPKREPGGVVADYMPRGIGLMDFFSRLEASNRISVEPARRAVMLTRRRTSSQKMLIDLGTTPRRLR